MKTPWHMAHLGGIFTRGPGYSIIEATAVLSVVFPPPPTFYPPLTPTGPQHPRRRRSLERRENRPHEASRRFRPHSGTEDGNPARSRRPQSQHTCPTALPGASADKENGGWSDNVLGASAIPFLPNDPATKEMTHEDIKLVVDGFVAAAKRVV